MKIAQNYNHPPLPEKRYQIIYADPPWDYKGQQQHNGRGGRETGGAVVHYPTVTTELMKKWDIARIADDNCLLFMWATSPHLDQAIDLGKAWGFQWATVGFVWDKQRVNPGFYTMSQCELCLIFKKNKIPWPRGMRSIRQMVSVPRSRHSEKPDEVRRRIQAMFPQQTKIELFARRKRNGWDVWGLDVTNLIPPTEYVQYNIATVHNDRTTPTLFLRDKRRTIEKNKKGRTTAYNI